MRKELSLGLLLWLVLVAAWIAFAPGIGGHFIFDDFPNLSGLSRINEQNSLASYLQYIANQVTGAAGRPLSLLSFALQHDSWPDHAGDFIRVNILLHLLNGALLFWGLLRLVHLAGSRVPLTKPLVLAATLIWLLCPLQGGTVLYIVQRMAVLAGTFMLLGLLLYIAGRQKLLAGHLKTGLFLMSAGVGSALGPGVLSKENAALFPLMLLVLEGTLLAEVPRPRSWKIWAAVFLGIPLAMLTAYLLWRLPGDLATTSAMGVTTPERLLTQPRVLFAYLQKMLLPSPFSIRIMYDDFQVSQGLWTPWTTWASLAGWTAIVGAAIFKPNPIFRFAVFWFLSCHLLESGFIPLEIAFDHRNYIAIIGVALALVCAAQAVLASAAARRVRAPLVAGFAAYLLFMGVTQLHTAVLWSQPYELRAYWGQVQPESRRVGYELAAAHYYEGHEAAAVRVQREALRHWPGDTTILFMMLEKICGMPDEKFPGLDEIRRSLEQFDGQVLTAVGTLDRLLRFKENGLCERIGTADMRALIELTFEFPAFYTSKLKTKHVLLARTYRLDGNSTAALDEFDRAFAIKPKTDHYFAAAQWALAAGDFDRALGYLDAADALILDSPLDAIAYRASFAELRTQLLQLRSRAGAIAR